MRSGWLPAATSDSVPRAEPPNGLVHARAATHVFTRTLRKGDHGADVRTLQTWLTDIGYSVPTTGYFGAITQTVAKGFQGNHNLRPATGVVGRRTAATLLALV